MAFDRKAYYQRTKEKQKATVAQWKLDNRERSLATTNASSASARFRDPVGYLLSVVKYRAKQNDIECTITRDDIVIPETCPVLGIPLFFVERTGSKKEKNPNSPSIDRIDSSKGYIVGNIMICSWRANFLKNDATAEELVAMSKYYAGLAERLNALDL